LARSLLTDEARELLREKIWETYGYQQCEPEVERFHKSTVRTKIASSPARTSKSYAGEKDILPDIIIHGMLLQMSLAGQLGDEVIETQRGWVVCPNYELAKEFDYFYTDLVERGVGMNWGYEIRDAKKNPRQGDMKIALFWGKNQRGEDVESIIEVRTSANEKSLQSEELDWAILSEAARLPEIVWFKYLSTRCGRSVWPTTPDVQAEWIYQLIKQGEENPSLGIENFSFTPRANPKYDWERYWVEHQKAELQVCNEIKTDPPDHTRAPSEDNGHDCFDPVVGCEAMKQDGFAEQFGGKWVFHRGRIVPLREKVGELGQPSHIVREDRGWFRHADLHVAIDYGYSDGTVVGFWLVGPKQVVLRKSIYETGLTPDDVVARTLDLVRWFRRTYDNEHMLKRLIGDPKKPEVAELFRRRGLPIWDVDKRAQADRAAGHLELMNYLQTDPATGEPGMLVHEDNTEVIREWRRLRRNDRVRNEDAVSSFIGADHAYDMARYFVMSRPVSIENVVNLKDSPFEQIRKRTLRAAEQRRRPTVRSALGGQRVGGLM
jgi:hypothetical protein